MWSSYRTVVDQRIPATTASHEAYNQAMTKSSMNSSNVWEVIDGFRYCLQSTHSDNTNTIIERTDREWTFRWIGRFCDILDDANLRPICRKNFRSIQRSIL